MKKTAIAILMVVFSSTLFADPAQIISLQKELLNMAKERHAIQSKNLEIREKMIVVLESHQSDKNRKAARSELKPLQTELKTNKNSINAIRQKMKAKRKELKTLLKANRKKKKPDVEIVAPAE